MIYLSDKIEGWVQNGPMGNDLMQNVLDWLIDPQLKQDIQSIGYSEGGLETRAQQFFEAWSQRIAGRQIGEYQTMDVPGDPMHPDSGFEGRWLPLHAQAKSWDNLSTNQQKDLTEAARIAEETGDTSAMFEVLGTGEGFFHDKMYYGQGEEYDYDFSNLTDVAIGYTPGGGAANINPLDAESILENIPVYGEKYRAGDIDPNQAIIQPLDLNKLMQMKPGYYSGEVTEQRQPLSQMLHEKRQTALGAGGGFEGYGRRGKLENIAEGSYLGRVEDIYSGIDTKRASTVDDIYAQLASWSDLEHSI